MYHAIVKKLAKRNFEAVNQKEYGAVLKGCAPHIHHRFGGNHALGGERHDAKALGLWFERLGRLVPDLVLKVQDIWVKGFPNDTAVIVRWTATAERIDGSRLQNHGVHIIQMRWGKVVSIDANEDSQVVTENLALLAAHGVAEAAAPPITS